ncbi:hypothetical protein ACHAXS_005295 [Conticribra weissflogii]
MASNRSTNKSIPSKERNPSAVGDVNGSSICHFNAQEDFGKSNADIIFNCKAPRRMFLGDIPLYLQEQTVIGSRGGKDSVLNDYPVGSIIPNNNLVRLMGKVIEILNESHSAPSQMVESSQISSSDPSLKRKRDAADEFETIVPENFSIRNISSIGQRGNESVYKIIKFVIDDGTGAIDVITRRRVGINEGTSIHGSSTPGPVTKPKQNPYVKKNKTQKIQQKKQTAEDMPREAVSISKIISAPPPPIMIGHSVDCVGQIHVDEKDENKIWLQACSVSIVKNPQEETLRQFELSSSVGENYPSEMINPIIQNNAFYSGRASYRDGGFPMNGVIAAGNLTYKLCPLHYRVLKQPHTQPFSCNPPIPEAVLNIDDAYRFIRCSRDDGGIFAKDLELLVGASRPNEKRAVRMAVEELQKQGMVYMKEGKYFPL